MSIPVFINELAPTTAPPLNTQGGFLGWEAYSATITVNVSLFIGNELAYVLYINNLIVNISLL